jgi:hypothetical protein
MKVVVFWHVFPCVAWQILIDVSEDLTAFIMSVVSESDSESLKSHMLNRVKEAGCECVE